MINIDNNYNCSRHNWNETIRSNTTLNYLFNISIPISSNKNEVVGPFILNTKDYFLNNKIIDEIKIKYPIEESIHKFNISYAKRTQDFNGFICDCFSGDIVVIEISKKLKSEYEELLYTAIFDNCINVTIRKEFELKEVCFKLPPIHYILVTNELDNLSKRIVENAAMVINNSLSEIELLRLKISDYLEKCELVLTKDALEYLTKYLIDKHYKTYLKYIYDYNFLYLKLEKLDVDDVANILSTISIK